MTRQVDFPLPDSAAELEKLRRDAMALLMAPYTQTTPWAITTLCVYFEHPLTPRGERCPCGKIRTKKDTI